MDLGEILLIFLLALLSGSKVVNINCHTQQKATIPCSHCCFGLQ